MAEVRKRVKEVWLVEKCRKCIERQGETRSMAACKEVKYIYNRFLAKTRMKSVKALENGVQICIRPCRGHGMRAAVHQCIVQERRLSGRHEKVKESPSRCMKFAERNTED